VRILSGNEGVRSLLNMVQGLKGQKASSGCFTLKCKGLNSQSVPDRKLGSGRLTKSLPNLLCAL
jgi:hypothetical protein